MNTQYFLLLPRWLLLLATWIFVLSPPEARAQNAEFAPIGAKWWYGTNCIYLTNCETKNGYLQYTVLKDTIVHEKNCKMICRDEYATSYYDYDGEELTFAPDTFYVHQNNSEVYVYHPPTQKFLLQYDFSLNVGDTLISRLRFNKFFQILIQSVDTVEINGMALRQLKGKVVATDALAFWQDNSFVITEKIGLYSGFLIDEILDVQAYHFGFTDYLIGSDELRCYEDTEIGLYHNEESKYPTCDYYEFTGIAANEAAAYTLPCRVGTQTIYFQLAQPPAEALSLDIYNMWGQQLYKGSYATAQHLYLSNNQPYIAVLKQDHIFIQSQIF
ncbi:MAG: hypothetical protein IPL35_10455 [Sphingobacteriales bacterium]|nr:hypothetical protein [Sphingobacteriales bacterium]